MDALQALINDTLLEEETNEPNSQAAATQTMPASPPPLVHQAAAYYGPPGYHPPPPPVPARSTKELEYQRIIKSLHARIASLEKNQHTLLGIIESTRKDVRKLKAGTVKLSLKFDDLHTSVHLIGETKVGSVPSSPKTYPPLNGVKHGALSLPFVWKRKALQSKIDVESLVRATKRRHVAITEVFAMQKDPRQNCDAKSLPHQINKPFYPGDVHESQVMSWSTPVPVKQIQDRSKYFSFDRPKTTNREKLSSAVNSHQAEFMKKIVAEKEKEMKLLQIQLLKVNTENVKLINELKGYRGRNYDAIYAENETLKGYVTRVSRENVILRGQLRTEGNKVIGKLNNEKRDNSATVRRTKSAKPVLRYR